MRSRLPYLAPYVALAVVVGATDGGGGLAVLLFFYFMAGGWIAFIEVWGWAARAAARRHVERLNEPPRRDDSATGTTVPTAAECVETGARERRYAKQPKPALTL